MVFVTFPRLPREPVPSYLNTKSGSPDVHTSTPLLFIPVMPLIRNAMRPLIRDNGRVLLPKSWIKSFLSCPPCITAFMHSYFVCSSSPSLLSDGFQWGSYDSQTFIGAEVFALINFVTMVIFTAILVILQAGVSEQLGMGESQCLMCSKP